MDFKKYWIIVHLANIYLFSVKILKMKSITIEFHETDESLLMALLKKFNFRWISEKNIQPELQPEPEEDFSVLPPEREALLSLSEWDDESLEKIENSHTYFKPVRTENRKHFERIPNLKIL
jgi:hypothetical protein